MHLVDIPPSEPTKHFLAWNVETERWMVTFQVAGFPFDGLNGRVFDLSNDAALLSSSYGSPKTHIKSSQDDPAMKPSSLPTDELVRRQMDFRCCN